MENHSTRRQSFRWRTAPDDDDATINLIFLLKMINKFYVHVYCLFGQCAYVALLFSGTLLRRYGL